MWVAVFIQPFDERFGGFEHLFLLFFRDGHWNNRTIVAIKTAINAISQSSTPTRMILAAMDVFMLMIVSI